MANAAVMSAEAQAFLDAAPAVAHVALAQCDIAQLRADIRRGFEAASLRALERHGVQVSEREIAGVPCQVVSPASDDTYRTVLYCYGGGYVTGSPFEDLPVSAALANHTKARVVAVDYRLAPEHPYPAAVDDGFAVYREISRTCVAGTWAMAGESAGGNLALALLHRAQAAGLALPAAIALLSPWCDLGDGGDSMTFNAGRDPTLHRDFLSDAAGAYAGTVNLQDPRISPLRGAFDDRLPPVIITTGTRDLLLSQCVRLARVMRQAGMTVDLRVWDGLWHVFEFYDQVPEAAQSLDEIASFLASRLDAETA